MKAKFEGQIRHHFWGEYSCTMVLVFDTRENATDAKAMLKDPSKETSWTAGVNPKAIVAVLDSKGLEFVKDKFAAWGMPEAMVSKVDSVAKSIDRGEPFSGEMEINPSNPNQASLF